MTDQIDRAQVGYDEAIGDGIRRTCGETFVYTFRWPNEKGEVRETRIEGTRCDREDFIQKNNLEDRPYAFTQARGKNPPCYGTDPSLFNPSVKVVALKPTS